MNIREYRPSGATLRDFLRSNAFVKGIMGPFGSGKTSAGIMSLIRCAQQQAKGPDGLRHTRFALVRGTYPELRTTTLNSFAQMMPLEYGKITYDSPIRFVLKTDEIEAEFYFLALEKDEDVKKVLSMELTAVFVDEAREIPKSLIDALSGRVGRYPSAAMGGCTSSFIAMATNPPDQESWWYRLSEIETPTGWAFWKQPSGLSPEAENLENLPKDYYSRLAAGKDEDWTAAFVHGRYAFVVDGKPVFSMWRDGRNVSPMPLVPVPGAGLIVGVDFGLSPAAAICQHLVDGRWWVVDELCGDDIGIKRFGELLVNFIRLNYPDHADNVTIFADPAGNQRAQTDEKTALEVLRTSCGWTCRAAPSNDLTARLEAVKQCIDRSRDGHPGLLVSPKAKTLRKGFSGGYFYKAIRSSNGAQYNETPCKNKFSHVHDALQYALISGGEGDVIRGKEHRRPRPGGAARIAIGVDPSPYDSDPPSYSSRRRDPIPGERGYRGSWR